MMTLRQRIFIGLSIIVAIILAILLYLFYNRKPVQDNSGQVSDAPTNSETATGLVNNTAAETPITPVISQPYSEDLYVRQLSKIFVERFATYSTQNPDGNTEDTFGLATPVMQAWMKTQAKPESRDYEGMTTEVLASSLVEKTEAKATVSIEVQQVLENKKDGATGNTNKKIRQRQGKVTLIKTGTEWKVDGLYWEKEV